MATPRLRIVPGKPSLMGDFVELCDPETMHAIGWTTEDVSSMATQVGSGRGPVRLVVVRDTGRTVGCVVPQRVGDALTLLGWIGTEHRRQGYGSEVLEFLCAHAFVDGCRSVTVAIPVSSPDLVPFLEQRDFVTTGSHQILNHHEELIDCLLYRRRPTKPDIPT